MVELKSGKDSKKPVKSILYETKNDQCASATHSLRLIN